MLLPQGLISRTKDFAEAYELIVSKLASLQDRLLAANGLQPDILAKKSQSDQFKVTLISDQSRVKSQAANISPGTFVDSSLSLSPLLQNSDVQPDPN